MTWQEILLSVCFGLSFIIVGINGYDVERLYEPNSRVSLAKERWIAWQGVIGFVLSVTSFLYLAYGTQISRHLMIPATGRNVISLIVMAAMLFLAWDSFLALRDIRRVKRNFPKTAR